MILLSILHRFLEHFNLGLYYKDSPVIKIPSEDGFVFKINSINSVTMNRLVKEFNDKAQKKVETPSEYRQT
jgi:hypothetical protein